MFAELIQNLSESMKVQVLRLFEVELTELVVNTPPDPNMGDLAFPFPFELAKQLKQSPRRLAEEFSARVEKGPEIDRVEVGGGGFVNVFFDRGFLLVALTKWLTSRTESKEPSGPKTIVEHTNINPNKAAHIGHLRNAILGDTLGRLLRSTGQNVEIQNYIDNTGVQVADVVVGLQKLRGLSLEQVRAIPEPFDFYCWDLYAEVSRWYEEKQERIRHRQDTLQELEEGQGPAADLAEHISNRIVEAHLKTMLRVGVRYDVLPRESDILGLKLWDEAFQLLKAKGAIHLAEDGPQAGCWVMPFEEDQGQLTDAKIIVRSNGTVTYVGKDIAYQLWKFGRLEPEFKYQVFHQYLDPPHTVWISSPTGKPLRFGSGSRVYNVIDVRQGYLQRVVVEGLRALGYNQEADKSIHYSYEMVALSPACSRELGIDLAASEGAKPFLEVSGRKGLGVKADDLLDRLIEKSSSEVRLRQTDLPQAEQDKIADQIAIGALRYFMLKFSRNTIIAFDFDEALNFEGETGPYIQYSAVRAYNIFRKAREKNLALEEDRAPSPEWDTPSPSLREAVQDDELWKLVLQIARLSTAVQYSVRSLELSHAAKQAFNLAQQFNVVYHRTHILSEQDRDKQRAYLFLVALTLLGLERTLDLLGIPIPDRM